jgi:hypothetical protein
MIHTDGIACLEALSGPTSRRRMRAPALAWALAFLSVLVPIGCATPSRNAVPKELASEAQIPGLPDVRDWGDRFSPVLQRSLVQSIHQTRANDPRGDGDESEAVIMLALSGGGADGALGAGFLCGWSSVSTDGGWGASLRAFIGAPAPSWLILLRIARAAGERKRVTR